MCQFCSDLRYKTHIIPEKTTSADDNRCEFGSPQIYDEEVFGKNCKDCDGCKEENRQFGLTVWENNLQLSYIHRIKKLVIESFSEPIKINFCPWCGKPLTDELVDFDKCCIGTTLKVEK